MRVAASVALAGLIVLGASGCEFISPQDTTQINQVADGMDATVGKVGIRNALLFTAGGTDANLVTTLVNTGSAAATVSMQYTSSTGPTTQQLTVPANGALSVRPGGDQVVTLSQVTAKAGALFPVYFTSGGSSTTVRVPVLDGSLSGYQTLTPTPTPVAIPGGTPTPSPTGSTSGSPAPIDSATPAAG
ncbi:MAG: hypothetical protein JWQ92_220 [Amnibacterium sp.]|nr:hypothetical protein [Amnibacterium sp.]